jgi:uncharacterized protein (DUF2147 family)
MRIAPCGEKICIWIVILAPGKHPDTDTHNPDPRLRSRPICELRIGSDFTETDPRHADDGRLYDPRSGHTYSGAMTAVGDRLHLRGYIGIRLFGRSETWTRVPKPTQVCTPPAHAASERGRSRRLARAAPASAPAGDRLH